MSAHDQLVPLLKKLRLSGVLNTLDLRKNQALEGKLSHLDFLLLLLQDEVARRDANQLALRLRRANFEHDRTIEGFEFIFNPSIHKDRVLDLASGAYLARKENILLLGPSGVGKSHLAQALGHRACQHGHDVLFVGAKDCFAQLRAARADATYDRRLARFVNPSLLILDDLGLQRLTTNEAEDLYEIIRQRYERRPTIITSNRSVEEFPELFIDPLLASAAMDRLLHHSHVMVIEGQSYRRAGRQFKQQERGKVATSKAE